MIGVTHLVLRDLSCILAKRKTQRPFLFPKYLKTDIIKLVYIKNHVLIFDKCLVDKIKGWIAGLEKTC
ncbi:MAG: hypothetical protein US74_C0006G0022 [Parcubacteria group bacterium GW2011_GWA2_38_13]|nr:MAG: hypothetical protein US74_C0006G0022 [Parcubacteria group bacterium GW2011_GWA2_38_13]